MSEAFNTDEKVEIFTLKRVFLGILLTVVTIMVVVVVLWWAQNEIGSFAVAGFDVAIGAILSVALVGIYAKQTEIMSEQSLVQKQQSGIMEKQRRLMKADHSPKIEVEGFEFDDDDIIIRFSNVAHGVAAKMEIQMELVVEEDLNLDLKKQTGVLTRYSDGDKHRKTGALGPYQEDVMFSGKCLLALHVTDDTVQEVSFRTAVEQLETYGVEMVTVELRAKVWNQLKEYEYVDINEYPYEVDLANDDTPYTLEEAWEIGQPALQ